MSTYTTQEVANYPQLKFLVNLLEGHEGFIAGGCFKNIFSKQDIKDVDIFFRNQHDADDALADFRARDDFEELYTNVNVTAFRQIGKEFRVECVTKQFGTPMEILSQFDFTITKMVMYNEEKQITKESSSVWDDASETETVNVPILQYHPQFFEHLVLKRLVIDEALPFPFSTFNRMIKYIRYGYNPCKDTKAILIDAIRSAPEVADIGVSLYEGID